MDCSGWIVLFVLWLANTQEPDGEEPQEIPQDPGTRGRPHGGGQVWLFPLYLWAAQRVPPVCGRVQEEPEKHLDHEASEDICNMKQM